jgi:hypothetical protein
MYTIFYAFQLGTDLAKVHYGQISTKLKRIGFYVGVLHHHDTSLQDNDGTTKAFSYPSGIQVCVLLLSSQYNAYSAKRLAFLVQNSPRKVHFLTS